jgi:hypothetical protein
MYLRLVIFDLALLRLRQAFARILIFDLLAR